MAKWKGHSDNAGFLSMNKRWSNLGKPRNKLAEGTKKFKLMEKRTKIKA